MRPASSTQALFLGAALGLSLTVLSASCGKTNNVVKHCNSTNCDGCCDQGSNTCIHPANFTDSQCGTGTAGDACQTCNGTCSPTTMTCTGGAAGGGAGGGGGGFPGLDGGLPGTCSGRGPPKRPAVS